MTRSLSIGKRARVGRYITKALDTHQSAIRERLILRLESLPQVGWAVQRTKKVVCVSPGLVDFAIGLVNSVLNLPEGQVSFLGNSNYRRTVINAAYQKIFRAS